MFLVENIVGFRTQQTTLNNVIRNVYISLKLYLDITYHSFRQSVLQIQITEGSGILAYLRENNFLNGQCNRNAFNTRNKVLATKLLRQGYRYHKLRKAFSKFYRWHFDITSKYVGFKKTASAKPTMKDEVMNWA